MARTQRKEEILRSELPPTLPLMALRSTIVYPLGTIAVQMGAPENLSIIRSNDEPGLIVGLLVATGDHDEPINADAFAGRVGVAARAHDAVTVLPLADRVGRQPGQARHRGDSIVRHTSARCSRGARWRPATSGAVRRLQVTPAAEPRRSRG